MSTDNDGAVPDSIGCPSEDGRLSPNATDDESTPSQYKKMLHDDDDDDEKEDGAKEANESEELINFDADSHAVAIDRDAALKIDCHDFMRRFEHMGAQLHAIPKSRKRH
jgi:hypothetical protein